MQSIVWEQSSKTIRVSYLACTQSGKLVTQKGKQVLIHVIGVKKKLPVL